MFLALPPETGASRYCTPFSFAKSLISIASAPSIVLQSINKLPDCTAEKIPLSPA